MKNFSRMWNQYYGALVIMSGYNGMVHLENPQENKSHADIVEQTLKEYGSKTDGASE